MSKGYELKNGKRPKFIDSKGKGHAIDNEFDPDSCRGIEFEFGGKLGRLEPTMPRRCATHFAAIRPNRKTRCDDMVIKENGDGSQYGKS